MVNANVIFIRLQFFLCTVLFCLIVLGAGVRLANAGLACPDWPLCLGKVVPDFNFQVFMEWIHRVVAAFSGLIALVVYIRIWLRPELRASLGLWALLSTFLFGYQAFLGRQTVLEFLKSETVASHLVGGYALFALNSLILLRWRKVERYVEANAIRWGFVLLLVLSFFQAILGAVVSSHYAGYACMEFPKCQGEWLPEMTGPVAFHMIHRFGAYTLLVASIGLFALTRKSKNIPLQKLAIAGVLLILLQGVWGVLMVFNEIHPALSLAHSATSLAIFGIYLVGAYRVRLE